MSLARPRPTGIRLLAALLALAAGAASAHEGIEVLGPAIAAEVARHPGDPAWRLEQAKALAIAGRFDEALAALAEARALGAERDAVAGLRARVLVAAGRHRQAKDELDALLGRRRDDGGAHYQRGLALMALARPGAAARDFAAAVGLLPHPAPEHVLAWRDALVAAGRRADAVAALDRGMQRVGEVASLQLAAIDLQSTRAEWADVLRRLDRLIAANPPNPAWLARRGDVQSQLARPEDAHESYARALALLERRRGGRRTGPTADLEQRLRAALDHERLSRKDTP